MPTPILTEALAEICAMEVPLARRLAMFVDWQRAFGLPFADANDAMVERLRTGDYGLEAPKVGETMPDFLLPDSRGHLRRLSEFVATGPVVVSFNRGHWCPFCRVELDALAKVHADLFEVGASIVSVLPDSHAFTGRIPAEVRERIVLLSDVDNEYAATLGLVMSVSAEMRRLMRRSRVDLALYHGNPLWALPLPATFVVGEDSRVLGRFIDPDFRQRMEPDAIRDLVLSAHRTAG